MTGKTISSKITKTVTLGSGGYTSPLTISSSGTIDPTAYGTTGLFVPAGVTGAIIVNKGVIDGASVLTTYPSAGGIAVSLNAAATLTNSAVIVGGRGGYNDTLYGLPGGAGIDALAADNITNTGVIEGGTGGAALGRYNFASGGYGGTGVIIDHVGATLTNTDNGGFLVGIFGGAGGGSNFQNGTGGVGGTGVALKYGVVVNNSFINGGNGGYADGDGDPNLAAGGFGVDGYEGTLTNGSKGSVTGGIGGQARENAYQGGAGGIGVTFFAAGIITNQGRIAGGAGGGSYESGNQGKGGVGGVGLEAGARTGAYVLSISNTGTITGGAGGYGSEFGGYGGAGVLVSSAVTMTNAGVIIGGAGGAAGSNGKLGGNGNFGAVVDYATFSNTGSVLGGAGGAGGKGDAAGAGGGGGYFEDSTVSNGGTITGGYGAIGLDGYGAIGVLGLNDVLSNAGQIAGGFGGGVGVRLAGGHAVNTGTITGGYGSAQDRIGGRGGNGAYIYSGATLNNSNLITGGTGGYGAYYNGPGYGGIGGTGVVIATNNKLVNGSTIAVLINSGTISGGAPGGGVYLGELGDAVSFANAGSLVVEQGAVFIGDVVADAAAIDVLELAGTSSTALTGIGTQFTGFKDISFATGAAWTIAGNTLGLANGPEITGFAAGDTVVLDGFAETGVALTGTAVVLDATPLNATIALGTSLSGDLLISTGGTNSTLSVRTGISGATITAGMRDFVLQHGTASKISVTSGGFLVADYGGNITSTTIEKSGEVLVYSGGAVSHTVVDSQATMFVDQGGSATATTIKTGGFEFVTAGGVSSNTTIAGGTLVLAGASSLTGKLKFTGSTGVLEVDQTEIPTAVISGFKAGDKVELVDAASGSGTATVAEAGVVTISAGGKTYTLHIAGAQVGATNFHFSGFALTETASSMAIARPADRADRTPVAHALPDLVAAGGYQAMAAAPAPHSRWCASAMPYAAPVHELIRVAHGGIQTMVTLQSGYG
jgi:hypothetical protein